MELPSTGWIRRYRVRAYGKADTAALAKIANGVEIEGVKYGPVEAKLDKATGDNQWLTIAIKEGKNREVKKLCEYLGLKVNRLIRVSFGPFALGELERGGIAEIAPKAMKAAIGDKFFKGSTDSHADRRRKIQRS